jgi:hypothetical protein
MLPGPWLNLPIPTSPAIPCGHRCVKIMMFCWGSISPSWNNAHSSNLVAHHGGLPGHGRYCWWHTPMVRSHHALLDRGSQSHWAMVFHGGSFIKWEFCSSYWPCISHPRYCYSHYGGLVVHQTLHVWNLGLQPWSCLQPGTSPGEIHCNVCLVFSDVIIRDSGSRLCDLLQFWVCKHQGHVIPQHSEGVQTHSDSRLAKS